MKQPECVWNRASTNPRTFERERPEACRGKKCGEGCRDFQRAKEEPEQLSLNYPKSGELSETQSKFKVGCVMP